MDDDGVHLGDRPLRALDSVTSNQRFIVASSGWHVSVFDIDTGRAWIANERCVDIHKPSPIVALSQINLNSLAISHGSKVVVVDPHDEEIKTEIRGAGRKVTAITWSPHDHHTLAIGTIDGRVALWSHKNPSQPLHILASLDGACNSIRFNPIHDTLILCVHKNHLLVWRLSPCPTILARVASWTTTNRLALAAWHPTVPQMLIVCTPDGFIGYFQQPSATSHGQDDQTCDEKANGTEPQESGPRYPIVQARPFDQNFTIDDEIEELACLGESGVILSSRKYGTAHIVNIDLAQNRASRVWSCKFEHLINCVRHLQSDMHPTIFGASDISVDFRDIPNKVLETVGWRKSSSRVHRSSFALSVNSSGTIQYHSSVSDLEQSEYRMIPLRFPDFHGPMASMRTLEKSLVHSPSSGVVDRLTRTPRLSLQTAKGRIGLSVTSLDGANKAETKRIITGSIFESISPPFSNQSIARSRGSHTQSSSSMPGLNSSLPSSQLEHDSDSDDDTFVDTLTASGTLLPGGVHVPLPKACGALFGPTGELLTFFPPKVRLKSALLDNDKATTRGERQATKIARIFPAFGNLISDGLNITSDFDSDVSSNTEITPDGVSSWSEHDIESEYPSQTQKVWKSRKLPVAAQLEVHTDCKIVVRVSHMPSIGSMLPHRRFLADQYHATTHSEEDIADVCNYNSKLAKSIGLIFVAEIWDLAALLLGSSNSARRKTYTPDNSEVAIFSTEIQAVDARNSGLCAFKDLTSEDDFEQLDWECHPLGGTWILQKLLDLLERKADVQTAAHVFALVTKSRPKAKVKLGPQRWNDLGSAASQAQRGRAQSSSMRLVTNLPHYEPQKRPAGLPERLHLSSARHDSTQINVSESSTPHIHSPTSMPSAFQFPSISRRSTGHSFGSTIQFVSRSSSPETSKGGFSAAARHYAQTITDKFADKLSLYSTSPPIPKSALSKSGGSPRHTDMLSSSLSSSLPRGSLSKSVSFVSNGETGIGVRVDRKEDLRWDMREKVLMNEGYDSEATVSGNKDSRLGSKAEASALVTITFKSKTPSSKLSSDRVNPSSLIPRSRISQITIWMQHYAESLRTWGFMELAADFDKTASLLEEQLELPAGISPRNKGAGYAISPASKSNREETQTIEKTSKACSICETIGRGVQQICPQCLHASHLSCLVDYMAVTHGSTESAHSENPWIGSYTCPTGCGCACAKLSFIEHDTLAQASPVTKHGHGRPTEQINISDPPKIITRKASLTDPRRWRARIEGDSW